GGAGGGDGGGAGRVGGGGLGGGGGGGGGGRFPPGVLGPSPPLCPPNFFVGRANPPPHPTPAARCAANGRSRTEPTGC
ncbi:MAG: hypothetical protein F4X43_09845, partial [Acidobacteria bacterium]|nr:hypothetical protein [Acidobacteriota bacterium]